MNKTSARIAALLTSIATLSGISVVAATYLVVDTDQSGCYDDRDEIACPPPGEPFYGQDSQYEGPQPSYRDNQDGTATDLNTGLMWQKSLIEDISWHEAVAGAASFDLGGYHDWRLPSIKELYSLIQFDGYFGTDSSSSIPFIDTDVFAFFYVGGNRFFDVQQWSSTSYVGTTMHGDSSAFGVNFADGRIKAYPKTQPGGGGPSRKYARYVRGPVYGAGAFADNQDGTITDHETGLTWTRMDSGEGMNWGEALSWVGARNQEGYLGHDDWRLPNAKELQSIVDYARAPDAINPDVRGPAIDPIFQTSTLPDGEVPYFWTGTTIADGPPSAMWRKAVYFAFGRALGRMGGQLVNTHGAGAQRCDPKAGNPGDYPNGLGEQHDLVRIYNHVRLVRGGNAPAGMNSPQPMEGRSGSLRLRVQPNPASGVIGVQFEMPVRSEARLTVHDPRGRLVRDLLHDVISPGTLRVNWDGTDASGRRVPSGTYFVRLRALGESWSAPAVTVP